MTKQQKVINYLARGLTLSETSAYNMFEVNNLRATISDIKPILKKDYGLIVNRTVGKSGETRYGVIQNSKRTKVKN